MLASSPSERARALLSKWPPLLRKAFLIGVINGSFFGVAEVHVLVEELEHEMVFIFADSSYIIVMSTVVALCVGILFMLVTLLLDRLMQRFVAAGFSAPRWLLLVSTIVTFGFAVRQYLAGYPGAAPAHIAFSVPIIMWLAVGVVGVRRRAP